MLDRKLAPNLVDVPNVSFVKPVKHVLDNGWEVYVLDSGSEEVVQIECSFKAGSKYQDKIFQAGVANKMLREGTRSFQSETLNEKIDYYGAFIQMEANRDVAAVSLYSLNKHLDKVLPIFEEVVFDAVFPEREMQIMLDKRRQQFLVNEQKVSAVGRKHFTALLFGRQHPYGRFGELEDYNMLNANDLVNYHDQYYKPANGVIVVAGKVPENLVEHLNATFGQRTAGNRAASNISEKPEAPKAHTQVIEREGAIQSSIHMGRLLFTKTHPDFLGMQILTTVLGGYFGSRLMSNIREDKGYTYGIGAGINALQDAGYFAISTEVGVEVTEATLQEINRELTRLNEDLIPEAELDLVRNYLLGAFLRSTDGPFAQSDRFMGLYYHGLGYDFYDQFIETIRTIQPERLRELSRTYLKPEDMRTLIVGKGF